MSPRVDSPTNLEMDDEEDGRDSTSLTSRQFRRVPTPMGQSHTTGSSSSPRQAEDCLFDTAEKSEKGFVRSQGSTTSNLGDLFGSDFEPTLNDLKNRAQGAARNGKLSLQQLMNSMSTPKNAAEKSKSASADNGDSNSSRALSLFDALAKPLMACSANLPQEIDDAVDLVANATTAVVRRAPSEDFSKDYSYDDDYDEARQITRMTSWNTLETSATYQTNASFVSHAADNAVATVYDDDGNPIPTVLVDITKEMRKKSTRRKRVVKFEYPPISSLKECPRPDPDDLPNLFFTEDELNQIEDDRRSTTTADDVEVVCVSSSESSECQPPAPSPPYESRPLRELGEVDESDTTSLLHQHETSKQTLQQKQRRYRISRK